jgi:hypothetical protein
MYPQAMVYGRLQAGELWGLRLGSLVLRVPRKEA